jgi:hypothetical protein
LDRVGLPAARGARDLGGRSVWIVLAPAVSLRKPRFKGVGCSWISLDSLVRIETFQWVTRDFREKISPLALSRQSNCRDGRARSRHAEAQDCSCGKPKPSSAFPQDVVQKMHGSCRDSCWSGEFEVRVGIRGSPEGVMAGERITLAPLAGRGKGEGRSKGPSSRSMAQRIPPIRNCFQRYGTAPRSRTRR